MRLNYDEINPFTGRQTVLVEWDENAQQNMKLCMETGYHTFDRWCVDANGNPVFGDLKKFTQYCPDEVYVTHKCDSNGFVWFKIVMQTRDHVLYPWNDGDSQIWKVSSWRFAEDNEIVDEGVPKIEIAGKYKILDNMTSSIYDENAFEDATIEFHRRCSEIYNTNEN